jgi:hypothetical protein
MRVAFCTSRSTAAVSCSTSDSTPHPVVARLCSFGHIGNLPFLLLQTRAPNFFTFPDKRHSEKQAPATELPPTQGEIAFTTPHPPRGLAKIKIGHCLPLTEHSNAQSYCCRCLISSSVFHSRVSSPVCEHKRNGISNSIN